MAPIGNVSGLASGIQWNDLITQLMQADTTQQLTPVTDRISAGQSRINAWKTYQDVVAKLGDATRQLRDGSAFASSKVAAGNSPITTRALLAASVSGSAAPGSYKVEVRDLARAEKLSGAVAASASSALGLSGDFLINGKRIQVTAADTLATVRDAINAANRGTAGSRVTATILSTGGSAARLILTSDVAGSAGIELTDGASGTLGQLGFVDGTSSANVTADGRTQSNRFSSVTASIATMLGVTMPPPSTIRVNGRNVPVDLSTQSLSSIAALIQNAGGTASTVSESVSGATTSRLQIDGSVALDPADTGDGARVLQLLGLTQAGRGAVAQTVKSGNVLSGASGAAAAGTLLTDLGNGSSAGVRAGDTLTIRGTRGDGSAVRVSYAVTGTDTVQSVLDAINDPAGGFGSGARPAAASIVGGQIRLTDSSSGDSQLSLSITSDNAGGGTLDFGASRTDTVGRVREITAGSDAKVVVDGVLLTRSSNTISDALTGVTLNLQQAEAGTTVDVGVTRDLDAMVGSVQKFASAYNDVLAAVAKQKAADAPLSLNGTLRTTMASLTKVMLSDVAGISGSPFTRAAIAGVALSKTGTLDVDETALRAALSSNLQDVSSLFGTSGTTGDPELLYSGATAKTQPGAHAIAISAAATAPLHAGTGFSGVYSDDGAADTMTVSDGVTGASGSIQLAAGDTSSVIRDKLNALFLSKGMGLSASLINGSDLSIASKHVGSSSSFTVAYAGAGADATAQLGFAAGTYAGTDVVGTIDGVAAIGAGAQLTGAAGTTAEGLAVQYSGSTAPKAGVVKYVLGVAGMMGGAVDAITRTGDGTIAGQVNSLDRSIGSDTKRASDIQARLDLKRASLVKQFTAMEQAISRLQSQGTFLTNQLKALQSSSNG